MKLDYKKLLEFFTKQNRQNLFLIIGVAGILLISVSEFYIHDNNKNASAEVTLNEYSDQLESEITDLLKNIEGVGEVKVMITLECGEEKIYVEQEKSESDNKIIQNGSDKQENMQNTYENEIVIVSSQNTNQPLIEKVLQPSVQGVAVVCSGADDISVLSAVTRTVAVVLNIPTNRICVTKMR